VAEDAAARDELLARTGRMAVPVITWTTRWSWASTGAAWNGSSGSDAMTVRCPDCGAEVELPAGVTSGDVLECPNW